MRPSKKTKKKIDYSEKKNFPKQREFREIYFFMDSDLFLLSLFGVKVGDALGAGWEMQPRHNILSHWSDVLAGYKKRTGKYGIYHQPGMYTDDYEMTIGTLLAIQCLYGFLCSNPRQELLTELRELLPKSWIVVAKVPMRDGYGSFRYVLENRNGDWERNLEEQRTKQRSSRYPGNGPLMRQIPFLFGFFSDKINCFDCAVVNVEATHPNPSAIMSAVCLMRASQYLLLEKGPPIHLLDVLIRFCQDKKTKNFVPADTIRDRYAQRITLLNSCEAPGDEKCNQLSDEAIGDMFGPTKCPYYDGIGIPPSSEQTFYAAVYLLKWMDDISGFGSLLRCISLGGDVDTLASIVASMVIPLKGKSSLPDWVKDNLEN